MTATILMIGTLDTKENEFMYLHNQLRLRGKNVLTVNVGVMSSSKKIQVDIDADVIAEAGGSSLFELRRDQNRSHAMKVMCQGAASIILSLFNAGRFQGIIGMGGGGGTSIATSAMRALPLGIPKVCVSTLASGDVSAYVGTKDIVMFPSLVDIAGINHLSRFTISHAAGALCGMLDTEIIPFSQKDAPVIAATMFGNTTPCVQRCMHQLRKLGCEVLVFHATGAGGKMMEALIEEGYVDAVLDLTTTELADEICGGMMSAGETRLTAAARMGIPQVIAPGCLDMVNFGPRLSVPQHYNKAGRNFYSWNPSNTLMRTNRHENRMIGEQIALRLNAAKGPVKVLLPLQGLSLLDEDGQPFCDRTADKVLFDTLKDMLLPHIEIIEINEAINHPTFADKAVEVLLDLLIPKYSMILNKERENGDSTQ
ncbi:Tm-1-like ATP-binding domain-containing protein [Paenibacillus abyssi]|uniref:Uncharacterized protein n=1 Tax=Paenibacillus abyssi TaxID=1340531 RepID=A0A917G5G6_9BACL|nr:Tm-1-like ATP-binding domain-containing protein [Paenibacillus abyssi]GGG22663.1 hypothetical protein GCM10010916_44180 [Paenibacillus abyssi]